MVFLTATALSVLLVQPNPARYTVNLGKTSPISPYIYGANFPDWKALKTKFPFVRQGGNRMTAYNWETNASNAGADWHHQNDSLMGETNEAGWAAKQFFQPGQANGAAVLLTVPTLGYVAADKKGDGDVNKTPNYLSTRFLKSLPKKPGGKFIYPPDTRDKVVYQDEFVSFVEKKKSPKTPVWYALDNEPDIWAGTHVRIMPKNPGYAWIIKNNIDFGSAIKDVAKKSLVFGPANYGWQGFRVFQDAPDAKGRDFLDTYLSAMKAAEKKAGHRILDVLDIHFYPEAKGGGKRITDGDTINAEARIQAPRSLWDPGYVEDSWIIDTLGGKPIVLLPRVKGQIAAHYPGTKLAITEYNYGGGKHPSGLVAQADVLGIYGRYGLFAAANWGLSPEDTAMIAAFRAFLNYDGKGSKFGSMGLEVKGGKASETSLYASLDPKRKGVITLVAINKTGQGKPFSVGVSGKLSSAKGFEARYDAPFQPKPVRVSTQGSSVSFVAPAFSVITIEAK